MPNWLFISLLVIIVLIFVVVFASTVANNLFEQNAKKEVSRLLSNIPEQKNDYLQEEDLTGLPDPVQRWLESTNIIGKKKIISVRLKQTGRMRTTIDGRWMEASAEQYFRIDEPEFVWKAKVKMAPLFSLAGLDRYSNGKGKMSIKLLSLFPVVDAEGPEIDQGTLLRYLGEMPWFPSAALSPYIKWDSIDVNNAKATMSYKGVSASGVFTFNANGDLVQFFAKRYREVKGKYELMDWGGVTKEVKEVNGIRIPTKSDIIWKEETGDFKWFECEIAAIEYNKPEDVLA
ncbi:DUF6544 family protein [Bacillus sp. T3]|uniref:DUF6544 family protein n=1 Tax=Bacillus sp. T3 TaxID=467262 RepID=UPI002980C83F|nr:DUF6544 family protein [Bacillus sp. T3]